MNKNIEKELSSIEEIIAEAKQGKMFILVDDEDRENEGDFIIPAQFADDKAINFMAKHGRGLICLSMDGKRIEELELPSMAQNNRTRHQTAFTVSIESREGVSTGISAQDRAKTIEVAIDESKGKYDLVSPGHVFPLEARDGGVLVRAGHTEAAVDISRLAGLNPSGVICEIMNDDGTMARLPELIEIAKQHDIKFATIPDLIKYRRATENLIEKVLTKQFKTKNAGDFKFCLYRSKLEYAEHIALVKGEIDSSKPVLVRMHQLDVLSDVLMAADSPKTSQLQKSMEIIDEAGSGVIVLLRTPDKQSLTRSLEKLYPDLKAKKIADETQPNELRDYGIGAQILLDLGVRDMTLLTNSGKNIVALDGYGLSIQSFKKII